MQESSPALRALEKLGIRYHLHRHGHRPRSLEQAARERGLEPQQIVRSLVFRLEGGKYVMVLMPGPQQVDWPKLRAHLGVSRVTMATAEEVQQMTGYEPGTVSPFGLPDDLRLLADASLLKLEKLSVGVGLRGAGIILKRRDLMDRLNPEIVDLRATSPN